MVKPDLSTTFLPDALRAVGSHGRATFTYDRPLEFPPAPEQCGLPPPSPAHVADGVDRNSSWNQIPRADRSTTTASLDEISHVMPAPSPFPLPQGISKPESSRSVRRKRVRGSGHPREQFQCPYCDKVSSENSNLKAHMRLHTGEKPYICQKDSCGKAFRWKSSLSYHQKAVHSNLRPYACQSCDKRFLEARKLQLHLDWCPAVRQSQQVPNRTGEKPSAFLGGVGQSESSAGEPHSHMVAATTLASIAAPSFCQF
jgi:hypothetical protein